jgi:outer membrane protein OmpA-like peptidoglycan-associated protein
MTKKSLFLLSCFIASLLSCSTAPNDLPEDINVFLIDEDTFVREPPIHQREVISGNFETIYFKLGGVIISREASLAIKSNVAFLANNPKINIILEGSCDNSGSSAFNLALGQKRSLEVKKFYVLLGVKADRIATISYGKENQISRIPELNRRVETKILTDRWIDIEI